MIHYLLATHINDFISAVPSVFFSVARYATLLPAFQQTHVSYDRFSAELCTLETAIAQLADAEETEPQTPEHLVNMTPELLMESQLYPRKALQLFTFNHLVNDYYKTVKEENLPPSVVQQPSFLAVFRHEDVVWRMDLEAEEYQLFSALCAGSTVGQALSTVGESTTERITTYFSRWMRNGLLAKGEYGGEPNERKPHVAHSFSYSVAAAHC